MASNDPELKDGFPLPLWMKTKPTKGYEPFAGSPPAHEENFFYIRYPSSDVLFGKNKNIQEAPNVISESKDLNAKAAFQSNKPKDWSKHTKPCQDVLHGIAPINTGVNPAAIKPKPAGTDDGFKGEGAACGNSIVKVAHQMISSTRGFTVASPDDGGEPEPPHRPARRGSKSLPASPRSSPTSRRKVQNRYFTSPYEPVEDASGRSWLTMALLGFKKDLTTSTSTLAEEDTLETRLQGSTLAESVENLGPSPRNKEKIPQMATEQPSLAKPANAFRPKPSELREMNFWSPTSM